MTYFNSSGRPTNAFGGLALFCTLLSIVSFPLVAILVPLSAMLVPGPRNIYLPFTCWGWGVD